MYAVVLFVSVASATFLGSYVALSTYASVTQKYPSPWHDFIIGGLCVSVGVVGYLFISGYSQENFAKFTSVTSLSSSVSFLFDRLLSTFSEVLLSVLALGFVCSILAVVIASVADLNDDETFKLVVLFAILGTGYYILKLVKYLFSATTNPNAHFHVLLLLSVFPPILVATVIRVFDAVRPTNSVLGHNIIIVSIISYPIFLIGLVANGGIGVLLIESPFQMPGVVAVGILVGSVSAGIVSTWHILGPVVRRLMLRAKQYTVIFVSTSLRTFRYVVILRPKNP